MQSVDESVKKLLSGEGKNIPLFKVFIPESVMEPLRKVLLSGYIGEGPRVQGIRKSSGKYEKTPARRAN